MTSAPLDVSPRPVRWESDGACRCAALLNVWGKRTTHYLSQCQTTPTTTATEGRAER